MRSLRIPIVFVEKFVRMMMNKQRHTFPLCSKRYTCHVYFCCVASLCASFTKLSSEIDWFYAIELKMLNNVVLFKVIAFKF